MGPTPGLLGPTPGRLGPTPGLLGPTPGRLGPTPGRLGPTPGRVALLGPDGGGEELPNGPDGGGEELLNGRSGELITCVRASADVKERILLSIILILGSLLDLLCIELFNRSACSVFNAAICR